jgi:(p)ppGpp synthase/HD superfamily hydrolase
MRGPYARAIRSSDMQDFPSFVDDLPVTRSALTFAEERHRGQLRDTDRAPFILHPLEVAHLLRGRGYPDHVVAAGVLHDVIEDTGVDYDELAVRFGDAVADLVREVSEPEGGGDYAQRKARLRAAVAEASADAVAVFAADKVAKTRELRLGLVGTDGEPDPVKLEHYWACLELLEHRLGHHALVRQLRFELEALALMPPGAPSAD